jgi:ATP synthase protein I
VKRPNKFGLKKYRKKRDRFQQEIRQKSRRKLKARRDEDENLWFWVGTFGLVGWAIAIPTLIGTAIGIWLDRTWESQYSWTLMMLLFGVILGCFNAWYWIQRERIER